MKYTCSQPRAKFATLISAVAIPAIAFFAFNLSASAQTAGYDLFQTGSGATVDLTSIGLPVVTLNGVPVMASTGNTDTIMHRTLDMPPGGGSVPVVMYALYMESASPVTYQGQSADVYITLNNSNGDISQATLPQVDTLNASTGTVTIRTDGTFDSSITVNADCIIVKHGLPPSNSGAILAHQAAPPILLTSTNSTWTVDPPAGYPESSALAPPSTFGASRTATVYTSGKFHPYPKHKGPHPVIPSMCPTNTSSSPTPSPTPGYPSVKRTEIAVQACISEAQALASAQ